MSNVVTENNRIKRGLCRRCGKRPPDPGTQSCGTCRDYMRRRSEAWRRSHGAKAWKPGGPGAPPKNRKREGAAMEPQCKPAGKPMRPEHDFDQEIDVCRACGLRRQAAVAPAASPRPLGRPIVAPRGAGPAKGSGERPSTPRPDFPASTPPIPIGAADGLARSAGGRRKPTPEQRVAFHSRGLTPAPPPRATPDPDPPAGAEDVATIPDPIAAVIAELELEREELDVTIDALKRRQVRKAARA